MCHIYKTAMSYLQIYYFCTLNHAFQSRFDVNFCQNFISEKVN